MTTRTTLQHAIASAMLLIGLHSLASATTEQALYIDGKVRTDGVSLEGTRVLVERDGIMVQMLTEDIGRIRMRLDLQRVYVLSFEREGCLTKKLLFDTHVPMEGLDNAPFTFPFKVTLVKNEAVAVVHYAQPVGFIRYFHAQRDFGYDKDYRMRRDEMPAEEMIAMQEARTEEAPTPVTVMEKEPASTPDIPKPEPVVTTALSARPTRMEAMAMRTAPLPSDLARIAPPTSYPEALHGPVMRPVPKSSAPAPKQHEEVTASSQPRPTVTTVVRIPHIEQPILPDGRVEEVEVEQTYVARIVRITEEGRTREYRRVTHRYGEVHYFCNGTSCSEASYSAAINEH